MAGSDTEEPQRLSRGRLTRGKGLRKTTGCLTCRRRHIKCDEIKPKCGGCVKKMVSCVYAHRPPAAKTGSRRKSSASEAASYDAPHEMDISIVTNGAASSTTEAAVASSLTTATRPELPPCSDAMALSPEAHQVAGSSAHPSHDESALTGELVNLRESHGTTEFNDASAAMASQINHYTQSYRSSGRRYSQVRPMRYDGPSPSQISNHSALLHFQGASDTSPSQAVESPTSRWLDLLIGDATLNNGALPDFDYDSGGFDVFGNSVANSPGLEETQVHRVNGNQVRAAPAAATTRSTWLQERIPYPRYEQLVERQIWQTSGRIELSAQEHILFQHFIRHISQWMDLFEPRKPLGAYVPRLALYNMGVMNAILALSARHLSLDGCDKPAYAENLVLDPNDAVGYYYKTLHYSQKAMQYDTYKTSLELIAISIIISTYEMLDGSSTDWEKHLEGVFWIQRSQVIHGDSGGLRQTVWWAWLCQDVWAAFREKRKPFTFWKGSRTLEDLDPPELAARAVYNFAFVVSYCSRKEREERGRDLAYRSFEADLLVQRLEDWRRFLTFEFDPLPLPPPTEDSGDAFPPVWIQPPAYAVAMQLYYCSLILIYLNRPLGGGVDEYLEQQRQLKRCSTMVCSIATTLTDYASSIMSSQCVFIAGMTITDSNRRATVVNLLDNCRRRTGWPGRSLGEDLAEIWGRSDHPEG